MISNSIGLTRFIIFIAVVVSVQISGVVLAGDPEIERTAGHSSLFAEKKVKQSFKITDLKDRDSFAPVAKWKVVIAGRTWATGSTQLKKDNTGGVTFDISITAPPVRDETVLTGQVTIEVEPKIGADAAQQPKSLTWQDSLSFYPADAFAGKRNTINQAQIVVYDPSGDTIAKLEAENLKIKVAKTVAALEKSKSRSILIGSGVNFAKSKVLRDQLTSLAKSGRTIICLAPSQGSFFVETNPLPTLQFFNRASLAKVYPTLDISETALTAVPISCSVEDGAMTIGRKEDSVGWPWCELSYPASAQRNAEMPTGKSHGNADEGGKVIVCGFQLDEAWDETPISRYMMAEILTNLVATQTRDLTTE